MNAFAPQTLFSDIETYVAMGPHRSSSRGNRKANDWMAGRLKALGFEVARQGYMIPYFEPREVHLTLNDGKRIEAFPQWMMALGRDADLEAKLTSFDPSDPPRSLKDKIAVLDLPFGRLSSYEDKRLGPLIDAAIAAGASAVAAITNGPTGEIIALNAKPGSALSVPVVLIAPKSAGPLRQAAAAGEAARLRYRIDGPMKGPVENVYGWLGQGTRKVVISTPLSGWFGCGSERGPGIAIFLALADWAAKNPNTAQFLFTANSGHELENLGAEKFLAEIAPKPDETHLWVHLGAGIASRDMHEGLGQMLPSADAQRYLMASQDLVPAAKAAFAGQPGLEQVYPAGPAAGELGHVIAAGYPRVIGALGATRWHHTPIDTAERTTGPLVALAAEAFREIVAGALET